MDASGVTEGEAPGRHAQRETPDAVLRATPHLRRTRQTAAGLADRRPALVGTSVPIAGWPAARQSARVARKTIAAANVLVGEHPIRRV